MSTSPSASHWTQRHTWQVILPTIDSTGWKLAFASMRSCCPSNSYVLFLYWSCQRRCSHLNGVVFNLFLRPVSFPRPFESLGRLSQWHCCRWWLGPLSIVNFHFHGKAFENGLHVGMFSKESQKTQRHSPWLCCYHPQSQHTIMVHTHRLVVPITIDVRSVQNAKWFVCALQFSSE
jgi:hypothetical protein